jgi:hypothetical protein
MSTQNNNYTVASLNVLTTTDGADSKASKPAWSTGRRPTEVQLYPRGGYNK